MRSNVNVIVIDDFYKDPDAVREFALKQDFGVDGNYPGHRTKSFLNDSLKKSIEDILSPHAGKVTYWGGHGNGDNYTGAFQYTTAFDRSWIHSDGTTKWAGVCYLTPDAPITAGTGLFRHKETGLRGGEPNINNAFEGNTWVDPTPYVRIDHAANIFNRLVIWDVKLIHAAPTYFGHNIDTARLTQVFFFDTEK